MPADVNAIERQYSSKAKQDSRYATDSDIEGIRYEIITMTASRSKRLRDKAFQSAKGICAVCERDFTKVLSGRGIRVLQVHHKRMLSKTESETQTRLDDLVVVCANCHLLLHLDLKKTLTVPQLKRMLATDD
jgi:predicted HNH restriction endonuclease